MTFYKCRINFFKLIVFSDQVRGVYNINVEFIFYSFIIYTAIHVYVF